MFSETVRFGAEATADSYERVPIGEFGKKMLSKLGWAEGKAIGRNPTNGLVDPIEYIPR